MNIFQVLETNYEVFHSRMLGWLLDERGSHGAGERYLSRFLALLGIVEQHQPSSIRLEASVRVPNSNRWRLADILLQSDDRLILIENKVDPLYQDPVQLQEEIDGGCAMAAQVGHHFTFVLVAPGPLTGETQSVLSSAACRFLSWDELLTAWQAVPTDGLDAVVSAILKQYFEFCRSRIRSTRSGTAIADGLTGGDGLLKAGEEAIRTLLAAQPMGAMVTAVDLWSEFLAQFPDHAERLRERWAKSSHYSEKAWFAFKLQAFSQRRVLLEDTGEWMERVDPQWGFPRVRLYRVIESSQTLQNVARWSH